MHGIGGCTIAEAKERIPYDELLSWSAYIKKRGSLNIGRRLEWGFALLAMYLAGGKKEMSDFMPHEEQKYASIEDVLNIFRGRG